MNYDTFFSLGLELDDKPAPCVRTASGTDMGAIGFAPLTFAINNHVFYPTVHCLQEPDETPYFRSRFFVFVIVQVVSGLLMAQRDSLQIIS